MERLWMEFLGYLRVYQSRIAPVLLIGFLVGGIFLILLKKGYTKYAEKSFVTILYGLFFSFSVAVVITMTFYGRTPGEEFTFRFLPFSSYVEACRSGSVEVVLQIIMNVVMFMPLGFFMPCCFKVFESNRTVFLSLLAASVGIELIQGITKIGMFEVDDIMGNVIGAEIGYLIWWGMIKMRKRMKEIRKHEKIAIGLAGLGIASLIISVFPGGYEVCTGILQGIGTGLFAGVAILFIGGTKAYEINEKNEAIDFLHRYRESIEAIYKIEINIDNKKVIINGMDYSIVMINYIPLQIKLFVEKYSDDRRFNKIASDSMVGFQKSLKENYYKEAINLCDGYNENFTDRDEFLTYARKIAALHNDFCEEVFDTDIDIMINESILKYNEEVSELNHSRI